MLPIVFPLVVNRLYVFQIVGAKPSKRINNPPTIRLIPCKYYLWSGTRYPLQTPFHSWSKRFLTLAACRPLTFLAMSMWGRCSPSVCTSLPMPRRNQFRTLWFSEEESISIPARPRESTNYDFRDKRLYIARCALITLKNYALNSNT